MPVKPPTPPPLPDELDRLLRRLRMPYVRRAAPEVIAYGLPATVSPAVREHDARPVIATLPALSLNSMPNRNPSP